MPLISCAFRRSRPSRSAALLRPFMLACLLLGAALVSQNALAEKAARGDHLHHHSGYRPERGR